MPLHNIQGYDKGCDFRDECMEFILFVSFIFNNYIQVLNMNSSKLILMLVNFMLQTSRLFKLILMLDNFMLQTSTLFKFILMLDNFILQTSTLFKTFNKIILNLCQV